MFSTIIIILAYIFLIVGSLCVALGFWQDWEEVNNAKKLPRNHQKPERPFKEILKYGGIFGKVDKINPHPYLPDGDEEEEGGDEK